MDDPAAAARGARQRQRTPLLPDLQSQQFVSGLRPQRWNWENSRPGALARALWLATGSAAVTHDQGETALRSGQVMWLRPGSARELRLEAGSSGLTVAMSDTLLAAAMGEHQGFNALRQVVANSCVIDLPGADAPRDGARDPMANAADEVVASLRSMAAATDSRLPGFRAYATAHLTIVLVGLWRLTSQSLAREVPNGPVGDRLRRFQHLVEARFRSRWPVAHYARELGLTPDGLHDLCVRTLGSSPSSVLHTRLMREAHSLLAGTDQSVERIAADLGFGSASHFSRFFKRRAGCGPRAWRRRAEVADGALVREPSSPPAERFAEWP